MTPEERAKWLLDAFKVPQTQIAIEFTTYQIRQAVDEARLKDFEGDDCTLARLEQVAFAKGKSEAYEEAAKVADDFMFTSDGRIYNDLVCQIADKIRALKEKK